jgi:ABC-type multidrug transport system fused ATPase/permease subunit
MTTDRKATEQPWDPDVDPDDPSFGVPFPEDNQALELGISVEFRNVSFIYPGSNVYALRKTSFKIEQGQLCVGSTMCVGQIASF